MHSPPETRVKICCIGSLDEARLAVRYGAFALGLVSAMPSGPGVIAEDLIAEIAASVPPGVGTFLLTSKQDSAAILTQQRRCRCNTIQLCDRIKEASYREMRQAMPGISLVQVIHVNGEESVLEAEAAGRYADALLLDSGNQSLSVKELGGTGRVHDWNLSARIRKSVSVPVFLAGGLTPENVKDAVEGVRPFAIDVCSGVRTNGMLDEEKLAGLFGELRMR